MTSALIHPLASTSHCQTILVHDAEETMVLTSCSVVSVSIGLFSFLFFALVCSASVFCFLSLLFLFLEYDYHDIYRLSIYSLYILIKIFVYTISPAGSNPAFLTPTFPRTVT